MLHFFRKFIGVKPNLTFKIAPEAMAEISNAEKAKEEIKNRFLSIDELSGKTPEAIKDYVKTVIEKRLNPEKYKEEIGDFIKAYAKDATDIERERLIKDSMVRYESHYEAALNDFFNVVEDNIVDHHEAYTALRGRIKTQTTAALDSLHLSVENIITVAGSMPEVESVSHRVPKGGVFEDIPIIGYQGEAFDIPILSQLIYSTEYLDYKDSKAESAEQFKTFLSALNEKFFNLDRQREYLSEEDLERYKELASEFKEGSEAHMLIRLESIFDHSHDKETLTKGLIELRDGTIATYQAFANKDGQMDLPELKRIKKNADQLATVPELIAFMNSEENDIQMQRRMESLNFHNREEWMKATKNLTGRLIVDIGRNGTEAAFIDFIQNNSDKKDLDFSEASDAFREIMEERAQIGVRETLQIIRDFNVKVNGGRMEALDYSDMKASIRPLVDTEREQLLDRKTLPHNRDDKIVVEFMSTSREGRINILKDPTRRKKLFQGIKNITKHYTIIYSEEYEKSLPETGSLTSSPNPDKPTKHDRIARMLAVLTLAKEAKWVIGNLDKSADLREIGLAKQLKGTDAQDNPPKINFKFTHADKRHKTYYRSELERGGFNGRSIFINVAKVWAVATLTLNLMNARKAGNVQQMLEAAVKNPYVAISGAAFLAIREVERRPELANILSQDKGGREAMLTRRSLDGLSKKAGRGKLKSFIGSGKEFALLNKLFEKEGATGGNETIVRLIEAAKTRNKNNPVITKEDMKAAMPDSELWRGLSKAGNRTRFLFYERFFKKTDKAKEIPNIWELQNNCLSWK